MESGVDVLPDRQAEVSTAWTHNHPDIPVVSRDCSSEYAKASTQEDLQMFQCSNRFHVVKNLTEATQRLLARCQAEIVAASKMAEIDQNEQRQQVISVEEWRPKEPAYAEKVRLARRAARSVRYQQVVELRAQGLVAKDIARQLDMSERTVQRWLAAGTFPESKRRRKKQSSFDTFASFVLERWQEGERNGLTLWHEIKEQGYTGSERTVYRYLETLKQANVKASVNPQRLQKFAANTAVWLFVRDPEILDEVEQEDLAAFCQASPTLKRAYDLIQDFIQMVYKREGDRLEIWLDQVATSDLTELQQFAAEVEKDKAAMKAILTSNGDF